MKADYPSYEQNRKHILRHTDFIESVVMNNPDSGIHTSNIRYCQWYRDKKALPKNTFISS